MKKLMLVIAALFLLPNAVFAQKFVGPDKAKPQQLVTLELDTPLGDDPKFQIVPKSNAFRVLKDFDGKPVIVFVPSEEDNGKTFLVVYAAVQKGANGEVKSVLATHAIEISGKPTPPEPKPTPTPTPDPTPAKNPYFDRLHSSYMVSPDSAKLAKLLIILGELKESTFDTNKEAAGILKKLGEKYLPEWSDLRLVRDEIQKIFEEEHGTNIQQLDKKKYRVTLETLIGALELLKKK